MHWLPSFACLVPLNDLARARMRSPFSGETAMSTTTQFPGSPRPVLPVPCGLLLVHAPTITSATTAIAHRRRAVTPNMPVSSSRKSTQREQHPGTREAREAAEVLRRPAAVSQAVLQLARHIRKPCAV